MMISFIKNILLCIGILSFLLAIPTGFSTYYLELLPSEESLILGTFMLAQGVVCIVSLALIEEAL